MLLTDYIRENFHGNQRYFASHVGVMPAQVTQWIKKGFIVVDGILYSPRRVIKNVE